MLVTGLAFPLALRWVAQQSGFHVRRPVKVSALRRVHAIAGRGVVGGTESPQRVRAPAGVRHGKSPSFAQWLALLREADRLGTAAMLPCERDSVLPDLK